MPGSGYAPATAQDTAEEHATTVAAAPIESDGVKFDGSGATIAVQRPPLYVSMTPAPVVAAVR